MFGARVKEQLAPGAAAAFQNCPAGAEKVNFCVLVTRPAPGRLRERRCDYDVSDILFSTPPPLHLFLFPPFPFRWSPCRERTYRDYMTHWCTPPRYSRYLLRPPQIISTSTLREPTLRSAPNSIILDRCSFTSATAKVRRTFQSLTQSLCCQSGRGSSTGVYVYKHGLRLAVSVKIN